MTVEDEDEEADRDDAERNGELGEQRTRAVASGGGWAVFSVQIGWLIVHSHPPDKSTGWRFA